MSNRNEKVTEFLSSLNTEIDILNLVQDLDDITDFDTLVNEIESENGFDVDVIYFGSAMEYLTENDTSLRESLQLAADMGFELQNLSSETLASLLKSQNVREEFYELEDEINNFFEGLDEDETED